MATILRRLASLLRRRQLERDLREEMDAHRVMVQERLERSGMTPEDAARETRRRFGNAAIAQDEVQDVWSWSAIDGLWKDVRVGARSLRRTPVLAAVAILTLALGIGANTAIFTVVRAVVLRPLPYGDPDRLALLWINDEKRGLPHLPTSYRLFQDWRERSRSFAGMGVFSSNAVILTGADAPERTMTAFVSAATFDVLRVPAAVGRTLSADDENRAQRVAVISHALWQRRFGGRADILDRTLEIDGDMNAYKKGPRQVRIVGVMPERFSFPNADTHVWEPSTMYWRFANEAEDRFEASSRRWGVVARLAPGATIAQAGAEMAAIGGHLALAYPLTTADFPGFAVSMVPMLEHWVDRRVQLALWILLGAVGCVLLIACANVANVLLARGAGRARELAIRAAIGAGRGRLARQLLVESALLAAAGGLAGLWTATLSVRALTAAALPGIPRLEELRIDGPVLAFTVCVAAVSGLLFGVAPAWSLSRHDPNDALKEGTGSASAGRRSRFVSGTLVVAQCALAVVLLTGAGLMIRSFLRLQAVDPGFNRERVLIVRVGLAPGLQPPPGVADESGAGMFATREDLFARIDERLKGIGGVVSAGAISDFMIRGDADDFVTIEGRANDPAGNTVPLAAADVSPEFFRTMQVPLLGGRFFTRADALEKIRLFFPQSRAARAAAPSRGEAVIVNQAFAGRYFPGDDAIDKRFYVGSLSGKHYWYRIVGIVGNMRRQGPEQPPIAEWYGQLIGNTTDLVIRTDRDPLLLASTIGDAVRGSDKHLMVLGMMTADQRLGAVTAARRAQTGLLALFASLALLLAALGIYGIVGHSVALRTREIGVRMAFGADRPTLLRSVIAESMRLPLLGLTIGIAAAAAATRLLRHLLFDVTALDPGTFAAVGVVLTATALVACWLPARRAAALDPLMALREL